MIKRNEKKVPTLGQCYGEFIMEKQRKQLSIASLECSNGMYQLLKNDMKLTDLSLISIINPDLISKL